MNFQIGQIVGDYRILGILGRGGMGAVYKVRNMLTAREDAMKVILPGGLAGLHVAIDARPPLLSPRGQASR